MVTIRGGKAGSLVLLQNTIRQVRDPVDKVTHRSLETSDWISVALVRLRTGPITSQHGVHPVLAAEIVGVDPIGHSELSRRCGGVAGFIGSARSVTVTGKAVAKFRTLRVRISRTGLVAVAIGVRPVRAAVAIGTLRDYEGEER